MKYNMKIIKLESQPFHEIVFQSSGARGKIRRCVLPFYKAIVDRLPKGISSIIATSDLQGREIGIENRLLGEVVSEELALLQELEEIPKINLIMLAGDLYDYPDCRKLGGTGDVTSVLNSFAENFDVVIGVHGNHDIVEIEKLKENITILDGSTISYMDLHIGGVSGIIGRLDRNQRKDKQQFKKALISVTAEKNDIVLLHQGPNDLENEQIGEPLIRQCLEKRGSGLIIFGHCNWSIPLVDIGNNQILNVDNRVYLLKEKCKN